jgi:hypothetical protein
LIARRQTWRLDQTVTQCGEERTGDKVGRRAWVATVPIGSQPTVELLQFRRDTFSLRPSGFEHAIRSE